MKTLFKILFSLIPFVCNDAMAHSINIETGNSKTSHNYFQLPNKDANKITVADDNYQTTYRIHGKIDLENDRFIYLVYAPFQTNYSFHSKKSFQFDNTNFSAGANTEVSYKFNAYRAGYFRKFTPKNDLRYWLGAVLNIRDAKIQVRQGNTKDSYSNIGIVPLIGAGIEYNLSNRFSILSHIDSLGFTQGYAYDVNAEVKYHFNHNSLSLGYRTNGGGVDNDTLVNFARFESFYIGYGRNF